MLTLKKRISLCIKNMLRFLPDRAYIQLYYFLKFGKLADIDNPISFGEKLQWYKLNYHNSLMHSLVDKYEVRSFVAKKIGENYLVPLIGVYSKFDQIDFTSLPKEFVLKCTHDSQSAVICKNKEDLALKKVKRHFNRMMRRDWFWQGREWSYKGIEPRIIAETLLAGRNGELPEDFKVYCFNGKAFLIGVYSGRYTSYFSRYWFDTDWNSLGDGNSPDSREGIIPRPGNLEELIHLSEILSEEFPHVRIDWFNVEDNLFFSEMTFYTSGGFSHYYNQSASYPDDLDLYLGEKFIISDSCNLNLE